MFSCYKDKSNTTLKKLDKFSVDGIKDKYNNFVAYRDTLKIKPIIIFEKKNKEFKYFWILFDGKNQKLDTISKEKDLNFPVNLKPTDYHLTFSVQDVETGIFVFKETGFTVETKTSSGLYVLKDKDGFTYLDLFSEMGTMNDIGRTLEGSAVRIAYTANFNYLNTETGEREKRARCIIPISTKDISMIRVSDFKELSKFNGLFYDPPSICKPSIWIENGRGYGDRIYFVNKNKIHSINIAGYRNMGKFGLSSEYYENDDYSLSKYFIHSKNVGDYGEEAILLFDETSSSFCYPFEDKLRSFKEEEEEEGKYPYENLNSDILYAGEMKVADKKGIALLKIRSGIHKDKLIVTHLDIEKCLFYYDDWEGTYVGGINPVLSMDTLSSDHEIAAADLYAANKEYNLFYYAKDNKISCYDLNTKEIKEIYSLAGGEKITYMFHYYIANDWGDEVMNKFVIATHANENYKVYVFDKMRAGAPEGKPKIMKGKGRVADVLYVKQQSFYKNN
jgi:hypothetical protein